MTKTFPAKFLKHDLDLPDAALYSEYVGRRRWSLTFRIVFAHEGKFWQTTYQEAATEMQDERPWEFQDEVECVQVQPVEQLVKVWEPV